jgi:hypothetical protein
MLFNLALESLVQMICQDTRIPGFAPPPSSLAISPPSPLHNSLKVLAYADDLPVFLNQPQEYYSLMKHFDTYNRASNSKLNVAKPQVISLAGDHLPFSWTSLFSSVGITEAFDRFSTDIIAYLGFLIVHMQTQQLQIEHKFLTTFDRVIQPHSNRSLSFRGRATVVNTLALSKLWHSLRLLNPSSSFFDQLQRKIRDFVAARRKIQVLA